MEEAKKKFKESAVLELVSFFTAEFFADDATGKTLCKKNLQEVLEKTEFLSYYGVNPAKESIIYLPT